MHFFWDLAHVIAGFSICYSRKSAGVANDTDDAGRLIINASVVAMIT